MTVLQYMKKQRDRVRSKHAGETFLCGHEEPVPLPERSARDILREIDNMEGFNVKERYSSRMGVTV